VKKKSDPTVELMMVRCVCGKGLIPATVKEISAGSFRARVEDQVMQCPACGSSDMKAAKEAAESQKKK
jgi:hypothetical protein